MEETELTHVQLMDKMRASLGELLEDPLLTDFSSDVTPEEVNSRLAIEQGRAITVHVRRFDDQIISIIVLQGATVNDLIKAFEREIIRQFKRSGKTTFISWKYVWRTYCLCFNHQKLMKRSAKLASYGITNNDEVTFLKKLKQEDRPKTFKRPNKQPFHPRTQSRQQ